MPNISALKRAVAASAAWRGGITGDDDATDEFDAEIEKQRRAVRDTERMARGVEQIANTVEFVTASMPPKLQRVMAAIVEELRALL